METAPPNSPPDHANGGPSGQAPLPRKRRERPAGLLAGMRIRKKLIFLHTCFSLVLAGILALALRPAVGEVVRQAELHEARMILSSALRARLAATREGIMTVEELRDLLGATGVEIREGPAEQLGLTPQEAEAVRVTPGGIREVEHAGDPPILATYDSVTGQYLIVTVRLTEARGAVLRLYLLMTLALIGVYGLVAAALELFVLPQHVYGPIRRMQDADEAVQDGRRDEELIPESAMPRDELGEIMRSRNASIVALRQHERDLAEALRQLEQVANDLKRKNHLLEMARQNLADADRLASLGMMSAGLSHEMNTPLAVIKGLAEKIHADNGKPGAGLTPDEAALMLRVVGRLERLSESLLDFARVRPPETRPTELRALTEEAWTLVSLDREAAEIEFVNRIPEGTVAPCDADRIMQVLVNLLRNSVDAVEGAMTRAPGPRSSNGAAKSAAPDQGRITAAAETLEREGRRWVSLTIADNGPGIDPEVLKRLFEPFVSTRLDARGTGLGLAVAEGIIREHGGLLLARNREDAGGAVFEILLPA